ncbi:MAG: PKD domain-containing protein, partial [Lentisphaerae bacterium]|nr:PKD domain-containing protein [Lentisphaerota bacterium]
KDATRFVTHVHQACAGGNRFVWRLTFAGSYPAKESIVQIYVDTDGDSKTGRSGQGCEYMLKVSGGNSGVSAFGPTGLGIVATQFPAIAVEGEFVYISFDADLAQRDGHSDYRLQVLSERLNPHSGADSIHYFRAIGPPLSMLPKVKLLEEVEANVGVAQTFGPQVVDPLLRDPRNVRIPIRSCELRSFALRGSEYRADNVIRSGGRGRIRAICPVEGRFYPGFILHDEPGREAISLRIDGERRGIAVGDFDDNDQHLFFLTEPVEVKKGSVFELRVLLATGRYRIEDLVLLREKPDVREPVYAFRHVGGREDRLAWISTWAVACTVEFGDGTKVVGKDALCNHRVTVPGVARGGARRFRITATAPGGKTIDSGWQQHTWELPPAVTTPRAGRVPLRLHAPTADVPAPWPVTCGIPFARGVLGSDRDVQVVDGQGNAVATQTSTTSRWPDGSVRWILLDFRHPGGTPQYAVEYGPAINRPWPTTTVPVPPALGGLTLVDAAGKAHSVDVADCELVAAGLLRSEFRAQGRVRGDEGQDVFAYDARLHVYPGLPYVRVLFSYGNCFAGSEFLSVQSLQWQLPELTGSDAFVRQHIDDHYDSSQGTGKRFEGAVGPVLLRDLWQNYPKDIHVTSKGTSIGLLPKLSPDEYAWATGKPEEHRLFYWFDDGRYKLRQGMSKTQEVWIGLDGTSPALDRPLYAAPAPEWFRDSKVFGEFPVTDPERSVIRGYDDGVNAAMKTYQANRERNREYGQLNFGDWWGERMINWGNIEYDTQHGFFLQFARSGDYRFFRAGEEAELHNRDIDTVHYHREAKRVGRAYAHCIGHVGNYYAKSPLPGRNQGTARGGFTVSHTWCEGHTDHYFLTGDRRSLDTARMIADNYDTNYTTSYDFTNCRIPGWHLILSMAAYRATGDPFHLNACRIIVERVLERHTPDPELGVPGGGWRRMMVPGHCLCTPAHYGNAGFMVGVLLTGLRHYHQETGDPAVADAICQGTKYLIEDMWVPEINGFRYTSCPKSSAGPWANLLLFDGISYAYGLQGDPLLARTMLAGTDTGTKAVSGFGKSFSQRIRVAPHSLGMLQKLRDDPPVPVARFDVRVPQTFGGSMEVTFDGSASSAPAGGARKWQWDFGDGSTGEGNPVTHRYETGGSHTVELCLRSGKLVDRTRATVRLPPRELLLASRKGALLIEAEAFSGQGGGTVKVPANRVGASGPMVTGWHMNVGHWLEWTITPPKPGRYHLVLKYATGSPDTRRELLLNGESPAPACREIRLPSTGGYCTGRDNWEYLTVGGTTPVALMLKSGKNRIRLTNLKDGLALDQLLLIAVP